MNIVVPVLTWLVKVLQSDPVIAKSCYSSATGWRIYEAQATKQRPATGALPAFPQNPNFPLIRVTWMSGLHMIGNGGRRFASSPRLMIEAVTNSEDLLEIVDAADRIDALFASRATGEANGLIVHGSTCISHDTRTDNANEVYKRLGGLYQFLVYEDPAGSSHSM